MKKKILGFLAVRLFCLLMTISLFDLSAHAQDQMSTKHMVDMMKEYLDLTQDQIVAIRLIMQNAVDQKQEIIEKESSDTNKGIIGSEIEHIDQDMAQRLSRILTRAQIDEWNNMREASQKGNK